MSRGKAEDLVVPQPEMDELKKGHSIIDRSQQSQAKARLSLID
jgi:hypothetical protein